MVRKNKFLPLFVFLSGMTLFLDQLTKYFLVRYSPDWSWKFFSIHLVWNTGAGFGLLQGYNFWLMLVSLLVALGMVFFYSRIPQEKVPQALFALFFGGVLGNLMDRLFRQRVIDFLDCRFWPAFNLADAVITFGAIGLVINFWRK